MSCNKKIVYSTIVVFFVFVSLFCLECRSSRIYFTRCNFGGFSCSIISGKYNLTYQCPPTENDPTLYLWQFRAPSNVDSLTIRNCSNFKISFQCTGENKPWRYLTVSNITNLYILKSVNTHSPPNIIFENIENLEYIPENAFSQIKRRFPISGCFNPVRDFQNLYFNKVNIGTIAPKAFNDLKDFGNFSWFQVNVKRLQHLAIDVDLNTRSIFFIRKSNIEICEQVAIKIVGQKALFFGNKFVEIYSGGINGTINTFVFNMNTVDSLQAYGFSLLSKEVQISDNRFEYLQSGALEKISPGLQQNAHINFGSLKFMYEFSYNSINFMDAGSLNPDMPAYDNVATELKFHHNNLICSCENVGWLFSEIGYGYKTALMQEFYETITEKEYKNRCSYTSCTLPLIFAKKLIANGKCLENKTAESLCVVENKVTVGTLKAKTQKPAHKSVNRANRFSAYINFVILMTLSVLF